MKFRADMGIADIFSRYLIDYYLSLGWDVDMIVPVPLGKRRYADRGYNQTHLLSRPFALYINKHHYNNCLKKIKETRPQVGLNPEERSKNVISAYWADPKTVSGKVILLIDDVTTTGSTINSCSEALLLAGASSVYGLTVARATIKTHTDIM
jgi:ComF family protein